MRRGLVTLLAVLAFQGLAGANITAWDCNADGDGAIDCTASWDANTYELSIVGNQYWFPGHMVGSFTTDPNNQDPNVKIITSIDNDTWFTWTDYHVNIYMNKTFTVSNALNYTPGDWTSSVSQPSGSPSTNYDSHGNLWSYLGEVDYYAGTSVPNGGSTLEFSYKLSFLGDVSFEQEMIPTPEPGTMSLLALGGLALIRRRRS